MLEIPKEVADLPVDDGLIPQQVAEIVEENDSQVPDYYLISFANYNKNLCEINLLTSNKARKAIELLKDIGTKICCEKDFQKHNIDRLPVYNFGDYRKLYRGLSADIELKEMKLQEDARIFYFDIEAQKTLYIVAITQNHLETDKVRR